MVRGARNKEIVFNVPEAKEFVAEALKATQKRKQAQNHNVLDEEWV